MTSGSCDALTFFSSSSSEMVTIAIPTSPPVPVVGVEAPLASGTLAVVSPPAQIFIILDS